MSIYKECDIRGIYEKEFGDSTAYDIGRALGGMMSGKLLAVAGDVRVSTPALKERLIAGLLESGANVCDMGMCPTPAFYFALANYAQFDGGVTVTASHNPKQYNGFKLMLGDMPVTPDVIRDIERRVKERDYPNGRGALSQRDVLQGYERSLAEHFPAGGLKVVIDCCNGAMSELAPRVFKQLGYEVEPLYCSFDGNFPNRDPNPAVYENLKDLCAAVVESKADLGVAFDGDGDRVVFVDELGRVVTSERSLVLFIRKYLADEPGSVVYDLKSSSIVKSAAQELGGEPLMERSGHAFIKKRFLENGSQLAGEISGHFFFKRLGYDDGLYAALDMASLISASGKRLSVLVDEVPQTVISPDLRAFCAYSERDALLDNVRDIGKGFEVTELDGVRVEFPHGWLLVRKSVTEEGVTARMEARDESAMLWLKARLLEAAPAFAAHPFFK